MEGLGIEGTGHSRCGSSGLVSVSELRQPRAWCRSSEGRCRWEPGFAGSRAGIRGPGSVRWQGDARQEREDAGRSRDARCRTRRPSRGAGVERACWACAVRRSERAFLGQAAGSEKV